MYSTQNFRLYLTVIVTKLDFNSREFWLVCVHSYQKWKTNHWFWDAIQCLHQFFEPRLAYDCHPAQLPRDDQMDSPCHGRGWYGRRECLWCHCQLSAVALDAIALDAVTLPPTPVTLDAVALPPTPVAVDAVAVELPTHCCANQGGPTVLLDSWNTRHSHWKGRVCSAAWTCWHAAWLVTHWMCASKRQSPWFHFSATWSKQN